MKRVNRTSLSFTDDELAILDAIRARKSSQEGREVTRTEIVVHFLLYHGLCGGDMPLTSRILNLPQKDRARIVKEIRKKAESGESAKTQRFQEWVKEVLGKSDKETVEKGADVLLQELLG